MSKLIERLRAHQSGTPHGSCQDCYANVMEDAADEIERLRKVLQAIHEHLAHDDDCPTLLQALAQSALEG